MDAENEEASVTLGISIPIDSSKKSELFKGSHSAIRQRRETLIDQFEFSGLAHSLDPNLGILGHLPPLNITHEKNTFNSWNIEPYFLHTLPISISNENSILIFGGLNPSSILKKIPPSFDNEDFVLGSTIFQYSLDSGIWKYYGTMIEPRCYHACTLDGQYVYITGGYSLLKQNYGEMLAISSTDRLDLNDRHWKNCANMIVPRAAHALVSHKGYLYVFGGRNALGNILKSVEMYDPDTDEWTQITFLPQPTMGLSATCIMDSIWLIGGITDHISKDPAKCLLSDVFSFVPSVKRWHTEESLPYACAFSSCISNDCAIWVIGGCIASNNSEEDTMISCSTVLQLSLSEALKWRPVSSLLFPRHALTAVLYDENIYVLAGIDSNNKCASDKVEVITTIDNISALCTKIPVPVVGCASALILERNNYSYTEETTSTFSNFSEKEALKRDIEHYLRESSQTSSILNEMNDVNKIDCLPPTSDASDTVHSHIESQEKTFSKGTEEIEIPITEKYSKSSKQTFSKGTEKIEIPVFEKFSKSSEEMVSKGTEKIEIPTTDKYSKSFEEKFSKEIEKIKNPTTEKYSKSSGETNIKKGNDAQEREFFSSDLNIVKTESDKNLKYRSSMEIFLESDEIGPFVLKRKPSSALKWLDYLKKLSVSDENFHKEVFQQKKPKLNVKTEVSTDREENLKTAEVKYFERDEILTPVSSTYVHSSEHKSFIYVDSNIKIQTVNVNSVQDLKDKMKETSGNTRILDGIELELGNLIGDSSVEEKILIDEASFPVIMLMGGEYSKKPARSRFILSYYCNKNVWKWAGCMPEYRCHHSAVLFKNKIYIIGGFLSENSKMNENITNKTMYYDIYDKIWHDAPNINYPRAYHSVVILKDKIYVLGGRDNLGGILSSVEVYSESNDVWKECESLPYPIMGSAAFCLNDYIHIYGGITYEDDEIISSKTAVFDATRNSWKIGYDIPIPLAFCGVSQHLNSVWLFGGLKEEEGDLVSSKDIFKSNIYTGKWNKVAELSISRFASITVSLENKVYIIGGHNTKEKKEVSICEVVDLSKNEVIFLQNLPICISGRAGIIITDKKRNIQKI